MHTLFDFITYIKEVEYLLALVFIAGYLFFKEILKPAPFHYLMKEGRSDFKTIIKSGFQQNIRTASRIIAAPFIGLAYVIATPFLFIFGLFAVIFGVKSGVKK